MRPFRLLLSLTGCVLGLTLLLYLGLAPPSDTLPGNDADDSKSGGRGATSKSRLGALFAFHGPLFPPSAIISLTDDNSTFFLARPAAFGRLLPGKGLSGQLWIGSGFANDAYGHGYPQATAEGELGCSDVPGWHEEYRLHHHPRRQKRRSYTSLTYGMGRNEGARAERREAQRWERSRVEDEAEEQFEKERADIEGKVVLLSRGGCGFLDKVMWAQRRGGVAVIVGDNVRSGPIITMYARGDTKNVSIPALFTSRTTAHLLSTLVPSGDAVEYDGAHTGESKARPYQPQSPVPNGLINRLATEDRGGFNHLSSLLGWDQPVRAGPNEHPRNPIRTYTNTGSMSVRETRKTTYAEFSVFSTTISRKELQTLHQGLWVTLTPTNMSSNPFLDTLLVLVVSPLVTLTVVYALLLLRSRMQRRRWRAPKSVVERLPVRTYHTLPASSSLATPVASSPTTPLLQTTHQPPSSGHSTGTATPGKASTEGIGAAEPEKQLHGLAEWRRRYGGRQRECVVCLEEYEDGVSRVMSLPCGHEFHAECM
ncbi:MAG: hypothetical protein INR71_00870 [Terriglobus roseus]|nr:hypothetical protein [Terriglobus roseus]